MKKLFMTMLAVLSCGAVQALPVANPAAASLLCDGIFWEGHCGDMCDPCLTWCDAFSMRLGFWGNYQFNRYLETDGSCEHRDLDVTRVISNAGYLVGNFWDRFDIYGTLGTTQIQAWGDMGILGQSGLGSNEVVQTGEALFHLTTNTDFAWSIGARGTVWECGCTSVGAEFQYLQTRPQLKFFDEYNNDNSNPDRYRQAFGCGYGVKYYDWQIGLGIAHRINLLVPYAAVRWSGAKLKLGSAQLIGAAGPSQGIANSTELVNFRAIKSWGYAVGVSLVDCEKMALTVEGGFAASLEASVIGEIRF